ncbi:choline dehydrogenase-like flavoprotein [Nonomuraea thailandensis]|uniref:Choline dehydrogenase-like flavoprotein n=1 Tax=Nonomuraea thailandensis TaxID=1188745 RepID=A0A9X2GCF3_9ACTN|nr:GMC oxidoreductase [Nonomuraea thailandensis]MCP2356579.1 choline dehydrogenase-like flavoprotein [Nonomuraea thailandensis]
MAHFPAPPRLPGRAGVIVVGGGMAGLELAGQLHRSGAGEVLVIESGPGLESRHVSQSYPERRAGEVVLRPERDRHFFRGWEPVGSPHFADGSGLRRRLGGRSLYWWGIVVPMDPWALIEPWWPASVIADLTGSRRGGASLYAQVAEDLGIPAAALSPGDTRGPGPSFSLAGLDFHPVPRAVRGTGSRWSAYSPLDYWRDPVTASPVRALDGVTIACQHTVERVLLRDGRAAGVRAVRAGDCDPVDIRADAVVLAAGTIENSRLVLRSRANGGTTRQRLTGLSDHIVQGFTLTLPAGAADPAVALPAGHFVSPGDGGHRSNLFLGTEELASGSVRVEVSTMGEHLPNERSFVEHRRAPDGTTSVHVGAALAEADEALVAEQQQRLGDLWRSLGARYGLPATPLVFGGFGTWRPLSGGLVTYASALGTVNHEGCTIRLGDGLTERHEVEDVPGLYVLGPATFPRLGAANPSLTTLALSRRLAAILAGPPRHGTACPSPARG